MNIRIMTCVLCSMSRPYGSASTLEQRRRQAVQAVQAGDSVKDVARIIGVNPRSIQRWLTLAQIPDGLAAKPHPGPATRLSLAQLQELEQLLCQGAQAHGWLNQLWTTQRIADLIHRHFGVLLHHDHVGRFLRQRLKWSPQKPRRRARERDEDAIAHWKSITFAEIVEAAAERDAHVVFLDESGFMLTPTVRRTWAPQGQTPLLKCWDRRDRLSAISCITVSPHRARLNFYFMLLPDNTNVTADHMVAFLRQLKKQLGSPFTVIWDGSKIHSRSRLVKEYLAKHPEIKAETLPSYAPELNPDEGVWGWTKYGRLANLAASTTLDLRRRLQEEFAELRNNRQLLDSFIQEANLCAA
jgi:transposase